MKITPITEHSFQLTRLGFVNCYLVHETDGFTLIDTGLSGSAEQILAAAQRCHAQICRVLLTHAHMDHIGSLDQLAHLLGTLDVAISDREAPLLPKPPAQVRTLRAGEPQCKVKGGFPGADTIPKHRLTPGELFGSLRCIATPGHTPGHMSFLDERDGTLFAGDALLTVGGNPHISGYGPWYVPTPLVTWHKPTARASIEALTPLPIQRVAPGHGKVLSGEGLLAAAFAEANKQ